MNAPVGVALPAGAYDGLRKLTSAGVVDTSYGMDGSALMQWGAVALRANGTAMALDAMGRVVQAGWYLEPPMRLLEAPA